MSDKLSNDSPEEDLKAIEKRASEWIVRRDHGFSARDQDAFHQWLAQDTRHRECYDRLQSAWANFDLLAQWKPEHSKEVNPHLLEYLKPSKKYRSLLGLAAGLVIVALGLLFFFKQGPSTPNREENGALEIASHSYQYYFFEDGSEVDLKAGTELLVTFTEDRRRVELLSGEAYFTVAKDSQRPFVVEIEGINVQALGTEFNVKYAQRESVEVLVTEGRVSIDPVKLWKEQKGFQDSGMEIKELNSGQRSKFGLSSKDLGMEIEDVTIDAVNEILRWKPKKLQFSGTPLAEVLDQFNEYNSAQLILADNSLADLPISGSFRTVNISGFMRLLELSGNVRLHRKSDQEIFIDRAPEFPGLQTYDN